MNYNITHLEEKRLFETEVDGCSAYLKYISGDGFIDIVKTFVDPAIEGRNIASALVKAACEYAKEKNLKIIPTCSYVGVWLKRHPEYGAGK